MRGFFGKDQEKKSKDQVQETEQRVQELSEEALDQVTGAGNPFDDIDRVPTQPIDEDLRDKV